MRNTAVAMLLLTLAACRAVAPDAEELCDEIENTDCLDVFGYEDRAECVDVQKQRWREDRDSGCEQEGADLSTCLWYGASADCARHYCDDESVALQACHTAHD